MAISTNIDKLTLAASRLQRGLNIIAKLNNKSIINLLDIAIDSEKKFIKQSLLQNYNSSGLGDTGKLKRIISKVNIKSKIKGNQFLLNITMPDGVMDYKDGKSTSNFYKVASSLQSGSVRFTGSRSGGFENQGFAAKTKQKIKKAILGKGKKNTIIAGQQIDLNSRKSEGVNTTVKSSGGTFVVTKPKPYFLLTSGQWAKLYNNLSENLDIILSKNFKSFLD